MTALEDTTILEVSTPQLDDVVRLEDLYGRAGTRPTRASLVGPSWSEAAEPAAEGSFRRQGLIGRTPATSGAGSAYPTSAHGASSSRPLVASCGV